MDGSDLSEMRRTLFWDCTGLRHLVNDADEETIKAAAMADEKVVARLVGKTVIKTIVVRGKLVNLVVK